MKKSKLSIIALCAAAVAALTSGCASKLTTVRPAEISSLVVERLEDGATVTLPDAQHDPELKDILIFQLEEPYEKAGNCADSDGHLYRASLYIGDKLDTEVFINSDGSSCRGGKRYIASKEADEPVNPADWGGLFELSSPVAAEPKSVSYSYGAMTVTAAQGESLPAFDAIPDSVTVAEAGAWSYYVGTAKLNGSDCAALWRDNPKGDFDVLCVIPQTSGDTSLRHDVRYEGGAAESEGKYLYFSLVDASTLHRSLWVLDTETLYFSLMYEAPCSNLVIPPDMQLDSAPPDYKDIGFVVHDRYLIPIELEKAEEYTGGVIDLGEYYGPLGEELFFGIGAFGTHKWVELSSAGDTAVQIDSILAEPETSAPEQRSSHLVDFASREFF